MHMCWWQKIENYFSMKSKSDEWQKLNTFLTAEKAYLLFIFYSWLVKIFVTYFCKARCNCTSINHFIMIMKIEIEIALEQNIKLLLVRFYVKTLTFTVLLRLVFALTYSCVMCMSCAIVRCIQKHKYSGILSHCFISYFAPTVVTQMWTFLQFRCLKSNKSANRIIV